MARTHCGKGFYESEGEWGGYKIRASKKGWLIDHWSMVSGHTTDRRVLIPFGEPVPKGADLCKLWSEHTTTGELLADLSRGPGHRVLRRGRKVY